MSRIAKEAVIITKGVDCKIDNGVISMKGPKGELSLKLNPLVTIKQDGDHCTLKLLTAAVKPMLLPVRSVHWSTT